MAEWTNRILRHRDVWEKIEALYLETYGHNPDVAKAWFQASNQKKVNEILALAFGMRILQDGANGKLRKEWDDEFLLLRHHFGLSDERVLTELMQEELEMALPILNLLRSIPEISALFQEIFSELPSEIKRMDASFTELELAMPCTRINDETNRAELWMQKECGLIMETAI